MSENERNSLLPFFLFVVVVFVIVVCWFILFKSGGREQNHQTTHAMFLGQHFIHAFRFCGILKEHYAAKKLSDVTDMFWNDTVGKQGGRKVRWDIVAFVIFRPQTKNLSGWAKEIFNDFDFKHVNCKSEFSGLFVTYQIWESEYGIIVLTLK